jgi:two-component system chemotaxis sensor kinase CheA
LDELLAEFLTETNESLAALDAALVRLESNPNDPDALGQIFRLVHTIKGTCGFLDLERLEVVTHATEAVLGRLRHGTAPDRTNVVTLALRASDRMKLILAGLAESGTEPPGNDRDLLAALERAATDEWTACSGAEDAASTSADTDLARVSANIRVPVEVLERLVRLASELVLTRNQLMQLAQTEQAASFTAPLQLLSQITSELQAAVMKTRMQPIETVWNKLPRMLRDLAHELGKRIELTMYGAETELDRRLLELIRDPLTHMVRNAADHGLEPPEERRTLGKPESGTVTLGARHEGGHVIIEIGDDGRGLSTERIRAKAVAEGLATEAELAALGDAELYRFIFRPGFSTARTVTAISGRGVGLDVVKTNIGEIGGTLDVRSVPGEGTTFVIRIPLTVAVISVLVMGVGTARFAIPQSGVEELVGLSRMGGDDGAVIEHIDGVKLLRLRKRLLPLVHLRALLQLPESATPDEAAVVAVLRTAGGRLGLIVDRVFDTEEIVVKPVSPILRWITLFGGTTILGDGSVIMILDPGGIARACGIGEGDQAPLEPPLPEAAPTERRPMLLVRAGGPHLLAIPLILVSRIEEIAREAIEHTASQRVTQYRGRLTPLVALGGGVDESAKLQTVLIFTEGEHIAGLMVDEVVDLVEDRVVVELACTQAGMLGTAVIAGQAMDIVDTNHWLKLAWGRSPETVVT